MLNHTIKFKFTIIILFLMTLLSEASLAQDAVTATIPVEDIQHFQFYPEKVKQLIHFSKELSSKRLTYLYGSADPKNNGMDCSGTIYYLLKSLNTTPPGRSAHSIYLWAKDKGHLVEPSKAENPTKAFNNLKPGDLLFWSGTYNTDNANDISHVMIYLGKDKNNDELMFGASNGRSYKHKKMWGVSVFDFKRDQVRRGYFIGFSCIPTLTCD